MANLMSNVMSNRNTEFEIRNVSQTCLNLIVFPLLCLSILMICFDMHLSLLHFGIYSFTGFTQKNIGRAIKYIAASFSTEFEMKQVMSSCGLICFSKA